MFIYVVLSICVILCFFICCVYSVCVFFFVFFKQKTAYDMRISDWSSDVCSSDLLRGHLVIEIDAGRGHLVPGLSPRATVGLLAHGSPLRTAPKPAWLPRKAGVGGEMRPERPAQADGGTEGRNAMEQIGRAHVWTPVTNAHLVCRLLLEKKKQ